MLSSLYPSVNWDSVRVVGCDMDGTLYDEADFIAQVYSPIAEILSNAACVDFNRLYSWMFLRWLEKGSSYSKIFSEAVEGTGLGRNKADTAIARCLRVFRNYEPRLSLTPRVKAILDVLKGEYSLFLISDGSAELQKRKFESLGLGHWFPWPDVGISGLYGDEFCKPNTGILRKIEVIETVCSPHQVLFFGDRAVDAKFASNAGFQFAHVSCMRSIVEG